MSIENAQLIITNVPIALSPAGTTSGCTLTLKNTHTAVIVALGGTGVTPTNGFRLGPGNILENLIVPADEQLFAVRVGSTSGTLDALRTGVNFPG